MSGWPLPLVGDSLDQANALGVVLDDWLTVAQGCLAARDRRCSWPPPQLPLVDVEAWRRQLVAGIAPADPDRDLLIVAVNRAAARSFAQHFKHIDAGGAA